MKLLSDVAKGLGREVETLHLGTCMKAAMENAHCPIDFPALKATLEQKFGVEVVLGTHAY